MPKWKHEDRELLRGETYEVRETLKQLGGTWDEVAQGWWIPRVNAPYAREIITKNRRLKEKRSGQQRLWKKIRGR